MYDGDALFTMATGESDAHPDVTLLGVAAAQAVARAIVNAVESAASVAGIPAARDVAK
jgi:L-aminopeptidase/D-esterase-like protein